MWLGQLTFNLRLKTHHVGKYYTMFLWFELIHIIFLTEKKKQNTQRKQKGSIYLGRQCDPKTLLTLYTDGIPQAVIIYPIHFEKESVCKTGNKCHTHNNSVYCSAMISGVEPWHSEKASVLMQRDLCCLLTAALLLSSFTSQFPNL